MKLWNVLFRRKRGQGSSQQRKAAKQDGRSGTAASRDTGEGLSGDVDENLRTIVTELGGSDDLTIRKIGVDGADSSVVAFIYIDNLVDSSTVNQMLLHPLMSEIGESSSGKSSEEWCRKIRDRALAVGRVHELRSPEEALACILEGHTIVFLQGSATALAADTSGGDRRAVEEPGSQTVIRGPKESFTESIKTNLSLIRRRIKSPRLRVERKTLGRLTQTQIALVYLHGIAKASIVEEIRRRIDRIDTDSVLESAYVEEFIQDVPITPFPTIENTERPDATAAGILEGQIAIIVDGTPFALLAPVTFVRFFQSSEDFYQRYDIATFLRLIRYVAFFVSMLLPAMFIAITTFHQEMLPTPLLISLAAQREGVPFPAIVEALLMEITFEVLREAGVRMPKVIGPAISIVGALVLGQSAVQAGLISAAIVIVVSFTAIASFVIPAINMSIAARLIRFVMMILGGTLGLFGIMSGLMVLLIHLASLRSFGVPYLAPLTPFVWTNWKDTFVRMPHWVMKKRPPTIADGSNLIRQGDDQMPKLPGRKSKF